MSDIQPSQLLERNPVTHKAHRREVLRQITIPFIVGIVVVLVLAFLAARGATNDVSRWADISLIWLILPTLLVAFLFTIVLGAIVYAIIWLVRKLPIYARRAQDLVASVGATVRRIDDKIVEPILRIQGFSASLQVLRRNLRRNSLRRS